MVTYWFWYGSQIVASVRVPEGTSEEAARSKALENFYSFPMCDAYENSIERANKILVAKVKVYPDGR